MRGITDLIRFHAYLQYFSLKIWSSYHRTGSTVLCARSSTKQVCKMKSLFGRASPSSQSCFLASPTTKQDPMKQLLSCFSSFSHMHNFPSEAENISFSSALSTFFPKNLFYHTFFKTILASPVKLLYRTEIKNNYSLRFKL